jgi:glutathione reductase (NADPH)
VHLDASVAAVEPTGSGYRVTIARAGRTETIDADLVVHGAGRVPDLTRLDLDAAGVASTADGVTVSPHLQSTNPSVWAAGDAADTPGMLLTPVAVGARWPHRTS